MDITGDTPAASVIAAKRSGLATAAEVREAVRLRRGKAPLYAVRRACDGKPPRGVVTVACEHSDGPCTGHTVKIGAEELTEGELASFALGTGDASIWARCYLAPDAARETFEAERADMPPRLVATWEAALAAAEGR